MRETIFPYEKFQVKCQRVLTSAIKKVGRTIRPDWLAFRCLCTVVLLTSLLLSCTPSWGEELASDGMAVPKTSAASDKIDSLLSKAFENDEPGVAVIAVDGGEVVFRNSYGMANMELKVPIRPDMVFRIGSVTKVFTAMAVMILVERGLISLDHEISHYLPEYPMHGEKITVRHLLTHTSGIKDLFSTEEYYRLMKEDCFRLMNDEVDLSELMNTFKDNELDFAPGEEYRYSNSGYFLLGHIIGIVSGKTYQEFLREEIFRPLNMKDTRFYDNINVIPNRALDYLQDDGVLINNPYESFSSILVYAAGGLMSTVDDLVRFDAALYTDKLVTSATLELMFTANKLNNAKITRNGLGWELRQLKGYKVVMHGGDVYGYSALMFRIPERRILVALMGNDERIHSIYLEYFAKKIAAILLGDPFPEWRAIILTPDQLARYAGSYRINEDNVRKVIVEGSRIFTQRNDRPKLELFPTSEGVFFYDKLLNYLTFEVDGRGRVSRMVMHYEDSREVAAVKE